MVRSIMLFAGWVTLLFTFGFFLWISWEPYFSGIYFDALKSVSKLSNFSNYYVSSVLCSPIIAHGHD
jgi:hypothetical protein